MKIPGLPTTVKIGLHPYRIKLRRRIEADTWLYGQTRAAMALIELNGTVAPSQLRDTLFHEILHAVIADQPVRLSEKREESVIRNITPVLLAVLRENPELVAFLLKE